MNTWSDGVVVDCWDNAVESITPVLRESVGRLAVKERKPNA
jgi:hypothetical protein